MSFPLRQWGVRAIVAAGQGARDQLREAIQRHSPRPIASVSYAHAGFRHVDGTWLYLHAGGAIGPDGTVPGINVELGEKLSALALPDPPGGEALCAAIRASLALRSLAPLAIMAPLLGATYRAPLCEVAPADLSIYLHGPTGAFKSELTALAMAHYGAWDRLHLPASWDDTANSLERLAFELKDSLLVIDDFVPKGTVQDIARLHATADRLFRSQGNRSGRGRMQPDGTLRPVLVPRGLVVSSGEDIPRGHSVGARLYLIRVQSGDVAPKDLSAAQAAAAQGTYALAQAGYVQWLAGHLDELREHLRGRQIAIRDSLDAASLHLRVPMTLASLQVGWETYLRYAVEHGVLVQVEADTILATVRAALVGGIEAQARHAASQSPAVRFIDLLRAVLATGQAHVASMAGEAPEHPAAWGWRSRTYHDSTGEEQLTWHPADEKQRIGYVDGEDLYLLPEATYAAVQRLAQQQQTGSFVTPQTLWKRLSEAGLLCTRESARGRFTVRRVVAGARAELLHLSARTTLDASPLQPSHSSHSSQTEPSPEETSATAAPDRGTVSVSWDGYERPTSTENGQVAAISPLVDKAAGTNGTDGTVTAYNGQGMGAGERDELEEFRI
jgi:hypothetical protein